MRIAIIADIAQGPVLRGGVQRSTAALATALTEAGLDVSVISPHRGPAPDDGSLPFSVLRTPMNGRGQVLYGYRGWVRSVRTVLERLRPDIVQGQALVHNASATVAWGGCPRVVAAHGNPLADARLAYGPGIRHAVEFALRRTVTHSLASADAVTNVTPDWRVNCTIEPDVHVYIPNPIEDAFFADRPAPHVRRVLYFGGRRLIKGLDLLLAGWPSVREAVPDATLELFGVARETVARMSSIPLSESHGLRFHDALPHDDVATHMKEGGVLVVPSRFEVAPVVIPEAWAAGIPVVATAVGGVPAFASEAARLCEPDAHRIAEALIGTLASADAGLVERGLVSAELHRAANVADAHVALYERLIAERS